MKRKFRKAIELIAFFVYNRIGSVFMKMDDHKVVFASEAQIALRGNLKAVYDKMPENYTKVVHIKGDRRDKSKLKEKLSLWKDLTTAKYILLDDFYGLISAIKVRNNQEIVQLWHGSGAFKKFGFSRIGTGDNINSVHKGYRKYTKAAVTAEPIRGCFAEAFDISIDKVAAVGSPRTDIFFDENEKEKARKRVYEKYPELLDKKVVLIAPTYRGRKVEDAHYDFEKLNINTLVKELGEEYKVVVKWHPALFNNIKRGKCQFDASNVVDMSEYPDINDILIVTDILVTDYSSVIFEWYLMDKPVVYFTYDLEEYKLGRGLYYDFEEYVYGDIVGDYESLLNAIISEYNSSDMRVAFFEKFMSACDGSSTKRIITWLIGRN